MKNFSFKLYKDGLEVILSTVQTTVDAIFFFISKQGKYYNIYKLYTKVHKVYNMGTKRFCWKVSTAYSITKVVFPEKSSVMG